MNLKTTLLGALLFAPLVARSQQAVVLASTFDAGAVSAKGSGNALRGSIGGSVSESMTRGGGVAYQSGFFSFLAIGGYVTSAEVKESPLPSVFYLWQNYPNPFNPSTTIRYGLPNKSQVSLTVYNTLGQHVATLVQADQEPGYHEVKFDGTNLSSGVYFYRLSVSRPASRDLVTQERDGQAGTFVETRKLLLLK